MTTMITDLQKINVALSEFEESKNKIIGFLSISNDFERRTVVANMAMMYADSHENSLIIDTDFVKDSYGKTFNLEKSVGLKDLITQGDVTLKDVIQPTEKNFLYVIRSDSSTNDNNYLLSSPKIPQYLDQCREDFEHVLLDINYDFNSDEQILLLKSCDLVILVENSGGAKKKTRNKFLKHMLKNNITIAGYINVEK